MSDPNVLFISGNWTDTGGRSNNYMNELITLFESKLGCQIASFNGGHINELEIILDNYMGDANIVFYAPNIPLELDRKLNPKDYNYRVVLITFKRNDNKYSYEDLTSQALASRSDLVCEVRKNPQGRYEMRIFDILGSLWSDFTTDTTKSVDDLLNRAKELLDYHYYKLKNVRRFIPDPEIDAEEVFNVYKDFGYFLKDLQFGDVPNRIRRHLGEISFRCPDNPIIVYSNARNALLSDSMNGSEFIPTKMVNGKIFYAGDKKPHLETGVFNSIMVDFPEINYIFHSHCYLEDAPFTDYPVTNGCIQEYDKVKSVIESQDRKSDLGLNLKGHGSLILGSDLEYVKEQFSNLHKRELPEAV